MHFLPDHEAQGRAIGLGHGVTLGVSSFEGARP